MLLCLHACLLAAALLPAPRRRPALPGRPRRACRCSRQGRRVQYASAVHRAQHLGLLGRLLFGLRRWGPAGWQPAARRDAPRCQLRGQAAAEVVHPALPPHPGHAVGDLVSRHLDAGGRLVRPAAAAGALAAQRPQSRVRCRAGCWGRGSSMLGAASSRWPAAVAAFCLPQNPGIIKRLNATGNEDCLFNASQPCVAAKPPFQYTVKITGGCRCPARAVLAATATPPASRTPPLNLLAPNATRCSGEVPQPQRQPQRGDSVRRGDTHGAARLPALPQGGGCHIPGGAVEPGR